MAPPPFSKQPTTAQLQGDIDSGRTGDKNAVLDPSLAPLGTDDEAAGQPPNAERVAMARGAEGVARWSGEGERKGYPHRRGGMALHGFVVLIALIAAAFLAVIWLR
jgi:hypothetical protein